MRLDPAEFSQHTGLCPRDFPWLDGNQAIVRLRDIAKIHSVIPMPETYLQGMFQNISYGHPPPVRGLAYEGCTIEDTFIWPEQLEITQNFVQTDKLDFFDRVFGSQLSGSSKDCFDSSECGALIVVGQTSDGFPVFAHYIPPIIEEYRPKLFLLEGMHRCYGSWLKRKQQRVIIVRSVTSPFPWNTVPWREVPIVKEKPPTEKRKFGGDPTFFRHFLPVGLDT